MATHATSGAAARGQQSSPWATGFALFAAVLMMIAGVVAYGIILGPIAIGLGLLARRNIAATGRPGIRLAWAGIFVGVVAFILPWFYVI